MVKVTAKTSGECPESASPGPFKSRDSSAGATKKAPTFAGRSFARRTQKPRIAGVGEREANVERATSRLKTAVKVDVARSRRG